MEQREKSVHWGRNPNGFVKEVVGVLIDWSRSFAHRMSNDNSYLLNTHVASFPDISFGKESAYNAGDSGSIARSGRSAGEGISYPLQYSWASLVAQMVKNPSAMQDTWVWSLGQEDPLKEGMAIHSRILAWRIPWTEEPGRLQSMGSQRVRHDWMTKHSTARRLSDTVSATNM